jgi:hypothetical protein
VTSPVGAYVASVDRLLTAGHGLFPASVGGFKVDGGPGAPPSAPDGSELSKGASDAADDYRRSKTATEDLDDHTNGTAGEGSDVGAQGRTSSRATRDAARTQAAAIMPATDSAGGVRLMASTMDQRISDMQRQIDSTKAQNRLLVARLRQVAAAYRGGMGGLGAGMPMGGGGFGGGTPAGMGTGGVGGLSGLAGVPATLMSSVTSGAGGAAGIPGALVGRSVGGVLSAGNAAGTERGLQKDTILARRAISAAFPQITDIGGVRADSLPWHPNGQAIDCMIPDPLSAQGKALGDQVLHFALSHWKEFNLNHVIWQNTIWNSPDHSAPFGAAWSDITQAHRNHVHVATNGGGFPRGGEVYQI